MSQAQRRRVEIDLEAVDEKIEADLARKRGEAKPSAAAEDGRRPMPHTATMEMARSKYKSMSSLAWEAAKRGEHGTSNAVRGPDAGQTDLR